MMQNNVADRKSFWWTVSIILTVICAIDLAAWFGLRFLGDSLSPLLTAAPGLSEVTTAIQTFHLFEQWVLIYALPGTFILFLLRDKLLWKKSTSSRTFAGWEI